MNLRQRFSDAREAEETDQFHVQKVEELFAEIYRLANELVVCISSYHDEIYLIALYLCRAKKRVVPYKLTLSRRNMVVFCKKRSKKLRWVGQIQESIDFSDNYTDRSGR